ncbi:DUF4386 domain-containing protein [Microbacterium sp. CFH 31415]|uniref:DUF4386 domain-containing protein n=1 Tax=Microbacterium sp. CFH 31415 TaxID=2921732 RepID=UPI001F146415|nr:DUF4386 domain-containing protein [Microbacterium sp. CFH 31415]MCH6231563.1 DUF4386 domain-containing protein [Microbacterium sp. CFH 31415]
MNALRRTARWTGGAYLALAVLGALGFLLVRPLAAESAGFARLGVALELGVVVAQSLAAVGFFALYRRDRPTEAYAVATFGIANAIAILGSAALLTAALAAPAETGSDAGGAAPLRSVADAFWTTGAVFFGLWLVPMGTFILATRLMPRLLGVLLIAGGACYVTSAVLAAALPEAGGTADLLGIPATVGELWMVGYLLTVGIRSAPSSRAPRSAAAVVG